MVEKFKERNGMPTELARSIEGINKISLVKNILLEEVTTGTRMFQIQLSYMYFMPLILVVIVLQRPQGQRPNLKFKRSIEVALHSMEEMSAGIKRGL